MTVLREAGYMRGSHQLCGKPGCLLRVGHGRHYWPFHLPAYSCECGFVSTRRDELARHLKQAAEANRGPRQATLLDDLTQFNPLRPMEVER